jgi:Transposase, Mutator family
MTDPTMGLRWLVEKAPDVDLLCELITFATERLMQIEVGTLTGATHDEKSANRLVQRNGYRERDWETRAGTAELHIPKATSRQLLPRLPRAAPDGREGTAVIQEAYIQGISTRSVDDLVKAMGMSGFSKSQVSRPFGPRPKDAANAMERILREADALLEVSADGDATSRDLSGSVVSPPSPELPNHSRPPASRRQRRPTGSHEIAAHVPSSNCTSLSHLGTSRHRKGETPRSMAMLGARRAGEREGTCSESCSAVAIRTAKAMRTAKSRKSCSHTWWAFIAPMH